MNVKIKLTRPVVVKGVNAPPVGEPFECPNAEAQVLLGMGAAEVVSPDSALSVPPEVIQTREPTVPHRDPAPESETPPPQSAPRKRAR